MKLTLALSHHTTQRGMSTGSSHYPPGASNTKLYLLHHTHHTLHSPTPHHPTQPNATPYANNSTPHNITPLENISSASGWFYSCKCTVKILELSFPIFLNADLVRFCLLQFYTLSFVQVLIFLLHKRNLEELVHIYGHIANA